MSYSLFECVRCKKTKWREMTVFVCQMCDDAMCDHERQLTHEKIELEKIVAKWQERAMQICGTMYTPMGLRQAELLLEQIRDADLGGE